MPKRAILITAILLNLTLAGCQSHKQSSVTSATSTTSSTSSTKTPEKAASDQANMKPYQVPKAEKEKHQYQKSGVLRLPGQFSYDQAGTKLTLKSTDALTRKTSRQLLSYRLTRVKQITNHAKTQKAKQMAEQAFNLAKLPNPYQTIQLTFTVRNQRSKPVAIDGIKKIKLNQSLINTGNSLSDASAGQVIGAHQSKQFTAMILVGPTNVKVKTMTVQFSGAYSQSGQQLSAAPTAISITL